MREILEHYIKKYGTFGNFKKVATKEEKIDYILNERSIKVSYDPYFLQVQHNLDFEFQQFIELGSDEYLFLENDDPVFSLYSNVCFYGEANLYTPDYLLINITDQIEFSSLYQYILYHKAVLFLDLKMAKNILNTNPKRELISLSNKINNIDKLVWYKFRIEIAERAIRNILKSNEFFRKQFLQAGRKIFVLNNSDNFWGMGDYKITNISNVLNFQKRNYIGKLLTKTRLEM